MMYRLLPLLLTAFLFTACGGQSTPAATTTPDMPTAVEAEAPGPIYEDIDAIDFADRIGAPNTVILDVRTPGETANGVIEGAIELDYRSPNFKDEVAKLDKDKTYLVYCASGGRSGKACSAMQGMGFREVYNLKGGYRAWTE